MGFSEVPCIYGNPEGLRRLARNLLHIANRNQADDDKLPKDDSYHCHLRTGLNSEAVDSLPRLRIGRADSVGDESELRDCFPALVPEFSDCSITDLDASHESTDGQDVADQASGAIDSKS